MLVIPEVACMVGDILLNHYLVNIEVIGTIGVLIGTRGSRRDDIAVVHIWVENTIDGTRVINFAIVDASGRNTLGAFDGSERCGIRSHVLRRQGDHFTSVSLGAETGVEDLVEFIRI